MNLGITEKVKNEGIADEVVYLPHKEVIKEDRLTTTLRIVFHASVKYKGTSSLNEVLYKGPCLNADLYSLLLKFRIYPIAVTSDKEKFISKSVSTKTIEISFDFCGIVIFQKKLSVNTGLLELFLV